MEKFDFTENDIDLLIEALDALPEKGAAGEMMGDLIASVFAGEDSDKRKQASLEREQKKLEKERANKRLMEDIKILQAKLLLLKRSMFIKYS